MQEQESWQLLTVAGVLKPDEWSINKNKDVGFVIIKMVL
jgi:hypothetical protein